ncbi:MAG: hypothetical protein OEW21_09055 [Betaproteobacteria bacterium]|nr:hypothetical protein [Betaproteobacteria bacterium]
MMQRPGIRSTAVAALLALTLAGCVAPPWQLTDKGGYTAENAAFKVSLPTGWMWAKYLNAGYYVPRAERGQWLAVDRVTLTRDGFGLEDIDLVRFDLKDAFPHLQKPFAGNMLPSEAADLLIADLKKAGLESLTVLGNEPATIAGKPGFKLHVAYKNGRGLSTERLMYGFGHKSGFYVLSYEAPGLYYFPTYKNAFLGVLNSFRLKG